MTTSFRARRSGPPRPMLWLAVGFVAADAYLYSTALFTRGPVTPPLPAPLFIPQAVALAVVLLAPRRYWGLLLGEYYLLLAGQTLWIRGPGAWLNHLSQVGDLLEVLVGALLLRRLIALPPRFDALRDVGLYAASVLAAAAVSATWAAGVRLAVGGETWPYWRAWFLSDGLASLLLAPTILLWVGALAVRPAVVSRRRLGEAGALAAALLAAGLVAFGTRNAGADTASALLYLPVPVLVWAAVRFGPLGLATALSLVAAGAVAAVANGLGPFVDHPRAANVYTLQIFLVAVGMPCFAVATLVRERQHAQRRQARSDARHRAVARHFPRGAVLLFGTDLRHLFADGEGLPGLGPDRDALLGATPAEAFPPGVAAALTPRYRSALAGEPASVDVDHAGRTYRVQVVPVSDGGDAVGLAVVQDVTDERRAAELAELDRARTIFFGNVSHELRTPLALLLGPLEELLAVPAAEQRPAERELLRVMHRNALRLRRLVDSLLDLSRLQAGHLRAAFTPTDLAAYTADLASAFRSAVERAGLALVVDCPPLSQPVHVDAEQWEHVVFNLLSNALKHTFAGRIVVALREANGRAVLTVADTGVGVPAAELPHVFERFHRVPGAPARAAEGAGIGLALVRELVRLHGGTVGVESALGRGSTFTVAIPLGSAHLPAERVAPAAGPARTASAAAYVEEAWGWLPAAGAPADAGEPVVDGPARDAARGARERLARLLVVDDEADMRGYLARLLRGRGVVRAAADGAEALATARAWEPDLVLTDVVLPGLDGLALLRALRADPRLRTASVIVLSARADDEARLAALRAGADDYLVKPFASAELLARVDGHLGLERLRGEAWTAAERRRLARELHDSVTQGLLAIALAADSLPRLWELDPAEGRGALADLRRLSQGALAEMRALLLELRPDALVRAPLHQLLGTLAAAAAARTDAVVETRLEPAPALPPDVQLGLYRIAQEALANAARHAQARRITVSLRAGRVGAGDRAATDEPLTLEITDDGRGFDPARGRPGGLGLTSIRERAAAIGAGLRVASQPGRGTTVAVTWTPALETGSVVAGETEDVV